MSSNSITGHPIGSSQSVQITWDDPTSRKEREKIMAQLNEESPGEAGQHNKEQVSMAYSTVVSNFVFHY